jgi:hypothetical protein
MALRWSGYLGSYLCERYPRIRRRRIEMNEWLTQALQNREELLRHAGRIGLRFPSVRVMVHGRGVLVVARGGGEWWVGLSC